MNTQTHLIDPSLHDFTDAKVGDKIYSLQYGEGVITSVANSEDYPIESGFSSPVSYTHLTLPTTLHECRSRWSPYH